MQVPNFEKSQWLKIFALGVCVTLFLFLESGWAQATGATLPQTHPYQITLRNWMATLTEADFDAPLSEFTWSSADAASTEELYRQWNVLRDYSNIGFSGKTRVMRAPAGDFVLDNGAGGGIEGSGEIQYYRDPAFAAFWATFDLPGNPHFGSQAMKLRAAVMAMVDMMMLDQYHENGGATRSDFVGGSMRPWVYIYDKTKDSLPADVQQAFLDGLVKQFALMESQGPKDINTNMDTRAIATAAYLYRATDDPLLKTRAVNLAKLFLFGSETGTPATSDGDLGIFHPAGYVGEDDGPETTYNGISLYYIAEAAAVTRGEPEWDAFLPEVVDRMVQFKGSQAFPDPDGYYDGPSNYSKRTADSYVYDQHGSYWRDVYSGMATDEGLYLVFGVKGRVDAGVFSEAEMAGTINQQVKSLNKGGALGGFAEADTNGPVVWAENHWPEDWPFTWDYYVADSYDKFKTAEDTDDPMIRAPFARTAHFNKSFDDEFWAYKNNDGSQDFGWFIESVPDAGGGYVEGYLGGGSLSEFWTQKTGTVIRGKLRGKPADVPDRWDNMETWATHHVWGFDASGNPFSTARNRSNAVIYDLANAVPTVTVTGSPQSSEKGVGGGLSGTVEYNRTFAAEANGLAITTEVTSDGTDSITELWESLPVFLRDGVKQSEDAKIAFRIGTTWTTVYDETGGIDDSTLYANVEAIRITRFGEHAYVSFDIPQEVKLASTVWTTDYQTDNRIRSIHVNLLGSTGTAVPFPAQATVSYKLTTTEPTGDNNAAPSVSLIAPLSGETFFAPADIVLQANAQDTDGIVTSVEFLNSGASLGQITTAPYDFVWTGVGAGTYTLTARATDDSGASTTSLPVVITVKDPVGNVNQAPVADDQALATLENSPTAITLTGSDPDGDPLVFAIQDLPAHGELSGAAPSVTYTPHANYVGSDSFTFTVSDGLLSSGVATVSLTVNVSTGNTTRIPLNDLGVGTYFGFQGGLYPGGSNTIPATHAGVGLALAQGIQPLDADGNPDPNGKIGLLSSGMSNASQEWCDRTRQEDIVISENCLVHTFTGQALADPDRDPHVGIANGAIGGFAAAEWVRQMDGLLDIVRDNRLIPSGLTEAQVQVVWAKHADREPTVSLPDGNADAFELVRHLGDIVRAYKGRYPNLKLFFLSSRIYAGYSQSTLNPEPYAYESGFAVKWLIEAQIHQMETGEIDPIAGDLNYNTVAPWLAWGPYLWADGLNPRSDGLIWEISDYDPDLTHPSVSGETKVGAALLEFFKTSPHATSWFVKQDTLPVNTPPVAMDQSVTTPENTAVEILLSGTDADGDTLTFTIGTAPANGILSGVAPTVTYTPAASFVGIDSFTFGVEDGQGGQDEGVVTIEVTAVNGVPVAEDQDVTTEQGIPVTFTLAASDPDGDDLTFSITSEPTFGTLTGEGTTWTYTPNPGFSGTDTLMFVASDGQATSNEATVTITVVESNMDENEPPVATFEVTQRGLLVQLDATESVDPDGTIISYLWNFGDGTQGMGSRVRHRYAEAGRHRIILMVTDDEGLHAMTSRVVTIRNVR